MERKSSKEYGVEGKKHGGLVADNGVADERRVSTADDMLAVMGYASELTRSRSTLQVAFMSFVLSAVPYGLATTLFYPLVGGGPVCVIWGWVLVCLIILCVAISLGEITSVYPTAGGVYYQTYMLSPPKYRNITAWICGWAYTLGNMTITLSVNFGTTLFIIGCINIFTDDAGLGIWQASTWQTWLTFVAVTLLCNAISAFGNKWLPLLDVCLLQPLPHATTGTSTFTELALYPLFRLSSRTTHLDQSSCDRTSKMTRNYADIDPRHLLSSGPLLASSQSSSASLPLPVKDVITPPMHSVASKPLQVGRPGGLSSSVSFTQPTRLPRPA